MPVMVSTSLSQPSMARKRPVHRPTQHSYRHVAHANMSVKRDHRATSPRMILTAEDSSKQLTQSITEIAELSNEPPHIPSVAPFDASMPAYGQLPMQYGRQDVAQTVLSPGHHEQMPVPASHIDGPYSPYFPFSSSGGERSDEESSDSQHSSSKSSSPRSPEAFQQSIEASLYTALGAGRLDPFSVYCKKDLPIYVHGILDHFLHHVCDTFTLASKQVELNAVRLYIMGHAMRDTLTWYAIILAGVTHYIWSRGEHEVAKELRMLRLSYKTQTMIEIRKQIEYNKGNVSDAALFGINTLAAHGGAYNTSTKLPFDRIQDSKAFGHANALNYYTAIDIEWQHWEILIRLLRQRGGPITLEHPSHIRGYPPSPGPGCLTTTDVMVAWRNLRCPEFPLAFGTDKVIDLQGLTRDPQAANMTQKLLSGFPTMPKNNMHSKRMTALLQKLRTFIVDFDQFQRGATVKFDLKMLHWTRMMLLHDLLLLPDLQASDNPLEVTYELCRNGLLAFHQLVLVPVVASNRMPEKILGQMIPLLERCTQTLNGRTLDREHPSLFLWAVVLAGMLAMEHYLSHGDSTLLDRVSVFFDHVTIKAEKNSWSTVTGILRNFLWLGSECDGPGQRYWNYACLWLADRSRTAALSNKG